MLNTSAPEIKLADAHRLKHHLSLIISTLNPFLHKQHSFSWLVETASEVSDFGLTLIYSLLMELSFGYFSLVMDSAWLES